jgi:hypothetical protein
MKTSATMMVLLLLCTAIAPVTVAQKIKTSPELFGVRLGMSEPEAREHLNKIGRLEREERRDAVWMLDGDRRYAYLIVGFDKETRRVRYVTAKARDGGERVRYAEALDIKRAKHVAAATNNYKFTQEVPAQKNHSRYLITSSGTDPKFLTFLSVKSISRAGDKEDNDK